MKCKSESIGPLGIIERVLSDIHNDNSQNTMKESIELIETQLNMIKNIEEIK